MFFRSNSKPEYGTNNYWNQPVKEGMTESKIQNQNDAVQELLDLIAQLIAREHYRNSNRRSSDSDESRPGNTTETTKTLGGNK